LILNQDHPVMLKCLILNQDHPVMLKTFDIE
jgi:hypothetical protein